MQDAGVCGCGRGVCADAGAGVPHRQAIGQRRACGDAAGDEQKGVPLSRGVRALTRPLAGYGGECAGCAGSGAHCK